MNALLPLNIRDDAGKYLKFWIAGMKADRMHVSPE
jgi:hypothetical protein